MIFFNSNLKSISLNTLGTETKTLAAFFPLALAGMTLAGLKRLLVDAAAALRAGRDEERPRLASAGAALVARLRLRGAAIMYEGREFDSVGARSLLSVLVTRPILIKPAKTSFTVCHHVNKHPSKFGHLRNFKAAVLFEMNYITSDMRDNLRII